MGVPPMSCHEHGRDAHATLKPAIHSACPCDGAPAGTDDRISRQALKGFTVTLYQYLPDRGRENASFVKQRSPGSAFRGREAARQTIAPSFFSPPLSLGLPLSTTLFLPLSCPRGARTDCAVGRHPISARLGRHISLAKNRARRGHEWGKEEESGWKEPEEGRRG